MNLPDGLGGDVPGSDLSDLVIHIEENRSRDGHRDGRVELHVAIAGEFLAGQRKERLVLVAYKLELGGGGVIRVGQARDLGGHEATVAAVGVIADEEMEVIVGFLLGGVQEGGHGDVALLLRARGEFALSFRRMS